MQTSYVRSHFPAWPQSQRCGFFAMASPDGAWSGLAVDMWRVIAEAQGWGYTLVEIPAPDVHQVL